MDRKAGTMESEYEINAGGASEMFVGELFTTVKKRMICIGVSFYRTIKLHKNIIVEQMERGVVFEFCFLSATADFGRIANQFGQTLSQLKTEVDATFAETDELSRKYPTQFRVILTDSPPTSRTYIADPDSDEPRGMIVFYAANTDSVLLPAWKVTNFRKQPWRTYLDDAMRKLEKDSTNDVFIIHGHDEAKRRELQSILTKLGARPIVLEEEEGHGSVSWLDRFIPVAERCEFAIAIFTRDDLIENSGKTYFQPRPNVMLELGWFISRLSRTRIMILRKGDIEMPSDLQGLVYHHFHTRVSEVSAALQAELGAARIIPRLGGEKSK